MAEAAVVSVATGVIRPLMAKLTKLLEEESSKLKGVRRNTRFIRDELNTMSATLDILADSEDLNPEMKIWKEHIRELSYDMEDCINDFMFFSEPTGFKGFFQNLKNLKLRHEIAGEIEELKARAIEASNRHERYKIDGGYMPFVWRLTPSSSIPAIDPRLHALYVEVDKLVGIRGPKEEIIEWFQKNNSSQQLKVLSIVGPGGLGKTTLANQVYNTLKSQYSCATLVSVSQQPDFRKILREIAKGVGITSYRSDDDVKQLIDRIREYLQDKRYFVVVDDVWGTEAWETMRLAFVNNNCGSRLIATTRVSPVASYCSSQGGHVYQMKPLGFTDSKRLLLARAFGSDNLHHPHLEEVSDKILGKCAGLPLAIITISSLLADRHAVEEWNRVLAGIGASLAKDPLAGNMTKILSLSYIDLPHHLRTCLLYLTAFPEDTIIKKRILISRWIAEGFIHEKQGQSKYEVGEGYFNDLINRSLIQPYKVIYGEAKACRVHDIILDFITCKATEENFMTSFDGTKLTHNSDCKVRRLCVINPNKGDLTMPKNMELSHVRSLTVSLGRMKNFWMFAPSLLTLDLQGCRDIGDWDLTHIQKMFLLKYLSLGQGNINKLPKNIEQLQNIETLNLRYTDIKELPSSLARLPRLARLYVNKYTRFPDGIIGQMRCLEDLNEFGISSWDAVKSLQEFSKLTNLRTLKVGCSDSIQDPDSVDEARRQFKELWSHVGTLISSETLHHLYFPGNRYIYSFYILMSLESWSHATPCSLRKLRISSWCINKVPKWMSSLGNLRELELLIFSMGPEDVAILGAMPVLLFLSLRVNHGTNGRILIRGFTGLKYFKLNLLFCGTALEFQAGAMPKLEHLELELPVHRMECLNGVSDFGIRHLLALTKLEVFVDSDNHYRKPDVHLTNKEAVSLIKTVIGTLCISPTISSSSRLRQSCLPFKEYIEYRTRRYGLLPEDVSRCN
ncbi:disease resistance protein RGA5-like [Lolium rigidum]|uniref:disease resistance protein RGA5-like n=1 Tax=Lolium rigidum TaxID=89674 RepID=UPI001F5C437B|nr:disease resistance protein RGA5-like [Lolium rigidum]